MNKSVLAITTGALAVAVIGLVCYVMVAPGVATASDHFINVWVQNDNGRPTTHVNVAELHKHGPDQNVFWDIDNSISIQSYKFPDNGIAFRASDGGTGVFDCRKQNDTKFKCKDPSGKIGKYKYTVTLVGAPQPDPLPVNPLDPFVVND